METALDSYPGRSGPRTRDSSPASVYFTPIPIFTDAAIDQRIAKSGMVASEGEKIERLRGRLPSLYGKPSGASSVG